MTLASWWHLNMAAITWDAAPDHGMTVQWSVHDLVWWWKSDQHLHPRFSEQRMPGEITSLKLLVWNLNHSAIIFSSRCVSVSIQPIIKGSSSAPILTEGLLSPSLSIWNNSVGSHQNQNIFRAPSNPHNLTTKQFRSDVIAEQGCHPYNEYWIDQHAREKGE